MRFRQLRVGPMANFAYVLGDEGTGVGAVVDPGFEPRRLLEEAEELGLEVTHVLVTHGHRDHVAALAEVVEATGAAVVAHPESALDPDVPLPHEGVVRLGDVEVVGLHTPGHAPDHVVYRADPHLLAGDLLFVGECGRTDLPGGDPRAMHRSLFQVLGELPGDLVVCPGHDYGPQPTRSLAQERASNYTLEERSVEEFVAFMAEP